MLPLFKIFSLVVRVFARPIIARTKQLHIKQAGQGKSTRRKLFFVKLGNFYHKWDQRIDSRFLGIEKKHNDFFFKPLNDEIALEKGVEFFYEIIIYTLLISLPMYEMYQSSVDSKEKSKQLQNQMKFQEQQIEGIKQIFENDRIQLQLQITNNELLKQEMTRFANTLSQDLEPLIKNNQNLNNDIKQIHSEYESIKNENHLLKEQMDRLQQNKSDN